LYLTIIWGTKLAYVIVEFVCQKCGYKFFRKIDTTPVIKLGAEGQNDSKKELVAIDCENPNKDCKGKAIGYC